MKIFPISPCLNGPTVVIRQQSTKEKTMNQHHRIKLPADRAAQIKGLAELHGISTSTAIGKLFRALNQNTDVPCDIPSIEINSLSDGLAIRFEKNKVTGFDFEAVAKITKLIREYLAGEHAGERNILLCAEHGGTLTLRRIGNGYKLAIPAAAPEKNFTPDLLQDFADLMDHAAVKAQH
ncbi:hypothetical protein [Sulfitobacter sp.]|uniref:hypothetical protein n=1 Tax=Sulfitobacter sp. TaxID=1903071 RepID=UPI0030039035